MGKLTQIKSELKTLNEAELHGVISGAILEIKSRAYHEGFDHAILNGHVAEEHRREPVGKPELSKSPQQIRDEIVEKAKRDVADLESRMIAPSPNFEGNSTFRNWRTVVRFVVNSEKRTIVALVFTERNGDLCEKGIAKCDPSDCFNVHIGKAIALRRALGLEVPTEYLNAPQPTEVRVGDVVTFPPSDEWHRIVNYRVDSLDSNVEQNLTVMYDVAEGPKVERAYADFSDGLGRLVIIDDSREEVTLNAEEI